MSDLPPIIDYSSPGTIKPPRKAPKAIFGWILFIGLAVLLFTVLQTNKRASSEVPLSEFAVQLQNQNVAEFVIDDNVLRGKFRRPVIQGSGQVMAFRVELPPNTAQSWNFMQWLLQTGGGSAEIRVENNQNLVINLLLPLVPWLLIFAFIWFFVFRKLRAQGQQKEPLRVIIVNPENK